MPGEGIKDVALLRRWATGLISLHEYRRPDYLLNFWLGTCPGAIVAEGINRYLIWPVFQGDTITCHELYTNLAVQIG